MSVTCIIVNWNSKDCVSECLKSIEDTAADIINQCILIDSGSFDGVEIIIRECFPWVTFIQAEKNLGFGAANNVASAYATGEQLLFLNPDTKLRCGCVDALSQAISDLPRAGIVGPKILNADGTIQASCVQADPTPWGLALDSDLLRKLFPRWSFWGNFEAFSREEPTSVDAVSGACMLVKRRLFEELGGFRGDYFMYSEDLDLCYRARKSGYKVYHVPGAEVVHYGGSSASLQPGAWSAVMLRKALETYMRLNYGKFQASLYRILQGASALIRLGMLWPVLVFPQGSKKQRMRSSANKWWSVFLWALGASRVSIPIPVSTPSTRID